MERIFALYDSDIFYATRFMEYFKKKRDFGFNMVIFTCKSSLDEFLQFHTIEILLLGEGIVTDEIDLDQVRYTYRLTDKAGSEFEENCTQIFKFQAAQSVMSDIMSDYRRHRNETGIISDPKQMKIVSIVSPIPDLESLLFAWTAGSLLSGHKKTLLVLLELLPVQFISSTDYSNQSLTEFIYYLKESPDIITKMNALLGYQGSCPYLAKAANGADILSLNKEDIHRWVTELRAHTDYQEIIFYIGFYSEAAVELINLSDSVLIPGKDTVYDKAFFKELAIQLERIGININQDKFHTLSLPKEDKIRQLPVSPLELSNTVLWQFTEKNINLL